MHRFPARFVLRYRLRDLPVDLSSREAIEQRLIGRKILLRGKPLTVDDFDGMTGTLRLRPDFRLRSETYAGATDEEPYFQSVDILSTEIYWFRKD